MSSDFWRVKRYLQYVPLYAGTIAPVFYLKKGSNPGGLRRWSLPLWLIVALLCQTVRGNAQPGPESLRRVIAVEECSEVSVRTATGWWLEIRPDGSARLGFGSSWGDDVRLPAGSFSFQELHRNLAALKFDGVGLTRDPSVAFLKRDADTSYSLSTSDHGAIKGVFQMARDRVKDFDKQGRLARIWAESPPIL